MTRTVAAMIAVASLLAAALAVMIMVLIDRTGANDEPSSESDVSTTASRDPVTETSSEAPAVVVDTSLTLAKACAEIGEAYLSMARGRGTPSSLGREWIGFAASARAAVNDANDDAQRQLEPVVRLIEKAVITEPMPSLDQTLTSMEDSTAALKRLRRTCFG